MDTVGNLGANFHNASDTADLKRSRTLKSFDYDFQDFFHPFISHLINQLNQTSVSGMLDPDFLAGLKLPYDPPPAGSPADYTPLDSASVSESVSVDLEPGVIDVSIGGPYANYNWELLYHIPVMVAVHLSSNQYFAEAQKWFHLVFDPTSTDTTAPVPERFWRSFVFRGSGDIENINTLLALLSTPDAGTSGTPPLDPAQIAAKTDLITGYNAILANPFQPHAVARTRPSAYQWYVVMKYLDNLIAWGDSLFLADTQGDDQRGGALLRARREPPRPAAADDAAARYDNPEKLPPAQAGRPGPDVERAGRTSSPSSRSIPCRVQARRPRPMIRAAPCSASAGRCTSASRRTRTSWPTGTRWPIGCSRSATARTSRASRSSSAVLSPAGPRHAHQGCRSRNRHRQHRQRPEPAARSEPMLAPDSEGARDRR